MKEILIPFTIFLVLLIIVIFTNNSQCSAVYDDEEYFTESLSSPATPGQFLLSDSSGNLSSFGAGNDQTVVSDINGNITTIPTGTFTNQVLANGGLSGTTGTFSGALKANGGLSGTTGNFSGALTANGGLSGTAGNFSGALTANGGLSGTTGNFSGSLTANGGLSGTTGNFSGSLTANGGLSGTTGNFSGALTANGGLSGTTGNFSGALTAPGGLTTSGIVIDKSKGDFSQGLVIKAGVKEPPYIDFQNSAGARNGYLMMDTNGKLTGLNTLCLGTTCISENDLKNVINVINNTNNSKANTMRNDGGVVDPPSWYLSKGSGKYYQFGRAPNAPVDFCIIETTVPWADFSGGIITQTATYVWDNALVYRRTSKDANTWTAWAVIQDLRDWSLDAGDGHLRVKYKGDQHLVVHNPTNSSLTWLKGGGYLRAGANNGTPWGNFWVNG